jgi:hypothetical protein
MKVTILYKSNSEQERPVTEFDHEYTQRTGRHLSLYDLNTRDGAAMASLYDVVQYPAVLATTDEGMMLQMWQGDQLPLINEVMYYSSAA